MFCTVLGLRGCHMQKGSRYADKALLQRSIFKKTLLPMLNSAMHFKKMNVPFGGCLKNTMEGRTETKGSSQRCLYHLEHGSHLDLKHTRPFKMGSHSAMILGYVVTW